MRHAIAVMTVTSKGMALGLADMESGRPLPNKAIELPDPPAAGRWR